MKCRFIRGLKNLGMGAMALAVVMVSSMLVSAGDKATAAAAVFAVVTALVVLCGSYVRVKRMEEECSAG